ncbi:DUF4857 domain-containing protein [Shewanella algae]|uniref:DUF4857 domain-containing protein n=1 Tax=Shewanella algae TaxID=38313 RepID=UPI00313F1756
MDTETKALLYKEWIKLRVSLLIALLMVGYGCIGCWLLLHSIYRSDGYFGLATIIADMTISRDPILLFTNFEILAFAAIVIGFAQTWPEAQQRRLRLSFHLPVAPERIIGIILITGTVSILSLFVIAIIAQWFIYLNYHMPAEQITDQLLSFCTWLFRALGIYATTVAFFATTSISLRFFAIVSSYFIFDVTVIPGYQLNLPSFPAYLGLVFLCLGLAVYTYLDFKYKTKQHVSDRIYRVMAAGIVSIALAYLVPRLYWQIVMPATSQQKLYYSQVNNDFIITTIPPEKAHSPNSTQTRVYQDQSGHKLNEETYKQALPFFYGQDLAKWHLWPKLIGGLSLTVEQAWNGWSKNQFSPEFWNSVEISIHRLIETNPKGSRYTLPPDLMRLNKDRNALEFYRPIDGKLDHDKGKLFTKAMLNAGAQMPIKMLNNNSSIRHKRIDNGFIIADTKNNIFQMKMLNGRPWIRNLGLTIPGRLRGLIINEDRFQRFMAYATTDEQLFAITQENTPKLIAINIEEYQVDDTSVDLMSDLLGITVVSKNLRLPYINRLLVGQRLTMAGQDTGNIFRLPMESNDITNVNYALKLTSTLFPVWITQSTSHSNWVKLHLETRWQHYPVFCALGITVSLILMLWRWRLMGSHLYIEDIILVCVFGPIGLAVFWLINIRKRVLITNAK